MQLYQDADDTVVSWRCERGKPIDKYALLIIIHREEDLIAAGVYFIIRALVEQEQVLLRDRLDRSLVKFHSGRSDSDPQQAAIRQSMIDQLVRMIQGCLFEDASDGLAMPLK